MQNYLQDRHYFFRYRNRLIIGFSGGSCSRPKRKYASALFVEIDTTAKSYKAPRCVLPIITNFDFRVSLPHLSNIYTEGFFLHKDNRVLLNSLHRFQ